jgi:hypothetical protein
MSTIRAYASDVHRSDAPLGDILLLLTRRQSTGSRFIRGQILLAAQSLYHVYPSRPRRRHQ